MWLLNSQVFRILNELRALPAVTIRMSGGNSLKTFYDGYTARHPRYKLIQRKRWGVALIPLQDSFDDYLRGKTKEFLRRNRRRCAALGYQFATVNPLEYLDQILDVNTSKAVRQGLPMDASYAERHRLVEQYSARRHEFYAALNSEGVLRAYVDAQVVGDVCILVRLLGHGDDLRTGIMSFCVSEVVREMIRRKGQTGQPLWVEYGTMFGASEGLRRFKEDLGFKPYKVRWVWSME
jgi:hypothetical protein